MREGIRIQVNNIFFNQNWYLVPMVGFFPSWCVTWARVEIKCQCRDFLLQYHDLYHRRADIAVATAKVQAKLVPVARRHRRAHENHVLALAHVLAARCAIAQRLVIKWEMKSRTCFSAETPNSHG